MWKSSVDRRTFLSGSVALAGSLVGCISTSATPPGQANANSGSGRSDQLLKAGGSSTVFPIVNRAASYWNGNYPAADAEYWGPTQYGISTDKRLADYWASFYGFESDDNSTPPFNVTVGLSHSGTGLEKMEAGQTDIANASAPVSAEFPDRTEEELEPFTNHVVGVDAQPIVVSNEIYEAGVTKMTADTVRAIYQDEITDWTEVESYTGPSKQIQAVGRSEGSGTDTAFRLNLLGSSDAPMSGVDARKGQNQQVKNLVSNSDNAIGYMALAFVDDSVPAVTLSFDGTEYVPGENLSDPAYPLSRDLHCYTWDGTSKKEAAFLRMILSDFGQQNFVSPVGYSELTDERQQAEIEKLPDTES
jgi:phosphate transport system substrate-binding protein